MSELLNYNELPHWFKDNQYIQTGYRKITHNTYKCIQSIFTLHNETFNIWSHLVGCIEFALLLINSFFENLNFENQIILAFYCFTVMICLLNSSVYHIFMCHSHKINLSCLTIDYLGIIFMIFGSVTLLLHGCFHDAMYKVFSIIYCLLFFIVLSCIASNIYNPSFYTNDNRSIKVFFLYIILSLILIPLFHTGLLVSFTSYHYIIMFSTFVSTCSQYITGMIMYTYRYPESLFKKNYFDYFGSSHNMWHIFVIFGANIHFIGMRHLLYFLE